MMRRHEEFLYIQTFRVCSCSAEHMRSSLVYYSTSANHSHSFEGINISYDFAETESKNHLNFTSENKSLVS